MGKLVKKLKERRAEYRVLTEEDEMMRQVVKFLLDYYAKKKCLHENGRT